MSWICPECFDQEMVPWPKDPAMLTCPACGGLLTEDDLADHYDKEERNAIYADLRAVWQLETRRRAAGGGGDDGLATLPDIRDNEADHCIVKSTTVVQSTKGKVVRIRCIASDSSEVRLAIHELFERLKVLTTFQ